MGFCSNICGFETGGTEEFASVSSAPSIVNTSPPSGGRYYAVGGNTNIINWFPDAETTPAVSGLCILGIRIRVATMPATGTQQIVLIQDSGGTNIARLRLTTGGVLDLIDGGSLRTITGPTITTNRWHYVEIGVRDEPGTNDGTLALWVDNVLYGSRTDADTGVNDVFRIELDLNLDSSVIHADDIYMLCNCDDLTARFGPSRVITFQNSVASATPDDGDNLDTGQWSNIGQTPSAAATAEYTGTPVQGRVHCDAANASGQGRGPLNQQLDNGRAPMEEWRMLGLKIMIDASRGNGGGTEHAVLMSASAWTFSTGTSRVGNPGRVVALSPSFSMFQIVPYPGEVWDGIDAVKIGANNARQQSVTATGALRVVFSTNASNRHTLNRSRDGLHWTATAQDQLSPSADFRQVRYDSVNGVWMAWDTTNRVLITSPDAVTWTERDVGLGNRSLGALVTHGGTTLAFGTSGDTDNRIRRSTDGGITWSNVTTEYTARPLRACVRKTSLTHWMAAGGTAADQVTVYSSDDGVTWALTSAAPTLQTYPDRVAWDDQTGTWAVASNWSNVSDQVLDISTNDGSNWANGASNRYGDGSKLYGFRAERDRFGGAQIGTHVTRDGWSNARFAFKESGSDGASLISSSADSGSTDLRHRMVKTKRGHFLETLAVARPYLLPHRYASIGFLCFGARNMEVREAWIHTLQREMMHVHVNRPHVQRTQMATRIRR